MDEKGFTLLELILIIVVLGVLAVAASPAFFAFSRDAEKAAVEELASALRAGTDLALYQATIRQLQSEERACLNGKYDTTTGDCSGNGILLRYGYPVVSFTNLSKIAHLDDWQYNELGIPDSGIVLARTERNLSQECRVIYRVPLENNQTPDIETYTDGC